MRKAYVPLLLLFLIIGQVGATPQPTSPLSNDCTTTTVPPTQSQWYTWPSVGFLIVLSGLFSGLTLGLLGLDVKELEIVASGDRKNKAFAQSIIPIRRHGNWLLCTLLLGNVAVNAALSILLAQVSGGTLGFIISTAIIVIFGEIIPQACCSRYALYIGAKTRYIVMFMMFIMSVIAWPISKILDWALGPEFGNMYTNMELKQLIKIHKDQEGVELDVTTAKMLEGALNLSGQTVGQIMTPWEQVYKLSLNQTLGFETLMTIFKRGYSRIPVVDVVQGQETVVGLLIVKDLILLDPEDEIPVSTLIQLFDHKVLCTWTDTSLEVIMHDFQKGLSHLAIVRKVNNEGPLDPVYENLGIVTLEDIIEVILQENIVDESDVFISMRSKAKLNRKFDFDKLALFDYRRNLKGVMLHTEAMAVYHHLIKSVRLFFGNNRKVSEVGLKNLLFSTPVIDVKVEGRTESEWVDENGLILYKEGVRTNHCVLILEGRVEILAGRQKFRSEHARWSLFCDGVLQNAQRHWESRTPYLDFVPDFTCRVIKDSRVLRISKDSFLMCLEGKYNTLPESFKQKPSFNSHSDEKKEFAMEVEREPGNIQPFEIA